MHTHFLPGYLRVIILEKLKEQVSLVDLEVRDSVNIGMPEGLPNTGLIMAHTG
jgi:hypothetical protein